ncbi:MAG: 4-vinyl reductase [Polyangiaceae bacterium]|nr:4-vinyl reductase [Polyangiaceae bacterium]
MGKIEEISAIARPEMGTDVPLIIFRAFRHFSADYVRKMLGRGAGVVFQNAGLELGREAGVQLRRPTLDEFLGEVTRFVRELKIGKLKPHEITDRTVKVGLDECITCAGMKPGGERICHFEVGLVAGIFEAFLERRVRASETLCNYAGEETCQVTLDLSVERVGGAEGAER